MNFKSGYLRFAIWLPFNPVQNRLRRLSEILFLSFIGIASITGVSRAQPPYSESNSSGIEGVKRPKWEFFRHREDWSILKDVPESQRTDLWDRIKYLPFDEQGRVWASFGGHMRFRLENWTDFSFGAPTDPDDTFLLSRFLLHSDLHLGKNIRVFVEGKSALSEDRDLPGGRRTIDVDTIELQQAFIDFRFHLPRQMTLTLRPGRQALGFGKERLVSTLPWGNTLRSWDGIRGIYEAGDWKAHGFWTRFDPVQKYDFNDSDEGNEFFGIYAIGKIANAGLDLYWLGIDREEQTFNGTSGTESRHTVGARIWGKFPNTSIDYDLEGAYQFGNLGSSDISAYMIATQIGYRKADVGGKPRLFLGLDYASGDDLAGGDVETFNQLFPLGHAHLGYMDIIGRQNIIDFNQGVAFHPFEKLVVNLHNHLFWRASASDAVYSAGGSVVRSGTAAVSKEVGDEFDLTTKYSFDRHLVGLFGYSHFFAGDFIQDSGADNDIDFIYLQLQYTF